MYRYIRTSSDWDSLSTADQMAVEYANQYLNQGMELEDAVRNACNDVTWGNAEPEYEEEEFYEEEPDYNSVLNYMKQTNSRTIKESIRCSSDREAEEFIDDEHDSNELKTYNIYFKDRFYGQVDAESEYDAYCQYEDVIPQYELATVDPDYIPDYVIAIPADEDDIEY